MRVTRKYENICVAHRLPKHTGKCKRMHGHNYDLTVSVSGPVSDEGVVLWYEQVDEAVMPWVDGVDHFTVLGESDPWLLALVDLMGDNVVRMPGGMDPTVENLAAWALADINARLPDGYRVARLDMTETSRSSVSLP